MAPKNSSPHDIETQIALLAEMPARIAAATAGLDDTQLAISSSPKQWSPVEVLAHLRGCADIWTYSIYAILSEEQPSLALLDPRKWVKVTGYGRLLFSQSLHHYQLQRQELVSVLAGLTDVSWLRKGDIAGRTHTIYSQARRLGLHELEHLEQIGASAGR